MKSPSTNEKGECLCVRCRKARTDIVIEPFDLRDFRYACEQCGNKRCPHHTWHGYACTASNEPNQIPECLPGFSKQ